MELSEDDVLAAFFEAVNEEVRCVIRVCTSRPVGAWPLPLLYPHLLCEFVTPEYFLNLMLDTLIRV